MLDYQYFKDLYQLTAVNHSNQTLHEKLGAIQKIGFYGMLKTNSQACMILEKTKKSFLKYKWLNAVK